MTRAGIDRRALLRLLAGTSLGLGGLGLVPQAFAAPAKLVRKPRVIVLDPGHGGIDPGCIGCTGVYEKGIALATAHDVANKLEATGRYRVKMTRTDDEFVPLEERVAFARAAEADLFLSIHADAVPEPSLRGASVFTLSEKASDKEAAMVAARENSADLVAGIKLTEHEPVVNEILFDLARRQTNNLSIRFARDLVSELGREVRLMNHSHRSAGFVVLKAPDIPSALVELGCLSNPGEDRLLQEIAYQHKLATGLVRSINDYFDYIAKT
jgi:N-acetylmuramoyl-L-alanine amidase